MTAATAESLGVPEIFNVATYFVDRNVALGRGTNIAIECGEKRITYEEVLRNVNRCGNALRRLGVRPEERVLLLLHDGPEFVYSFYAAIKIGAVPVPLNTLWKAADYQYVMRDSRATVLIVGAAFLPLIQSIPTGERPSLRHIIVASGPGSPREQRVDAHAHPVRCAARAGRRRARGRADAPRRAGVLALFVRQHRPAERVRPPAPRHGGLRRAVRQRRARHPGDRPVLQRREAVLRLWAGQRAVLSVLGRRDGDPLAGPADAAERLRRHRGAPADAVLLRADRLRDDAGARTRAELVRPTARRSAPRPRGLRSLVDPSRGLRRRSAAAGVVRALQGAVRRRHPRWHRLDRGAAHVHLQPAGRDPARLERPARPGL